jgi:hypothetical protein
MVSQVFKRWWGGAACVLLGGLFLALLLTTDARPADEGAKAALPADLAKIPGDALLVISGRARDLWGSQLLSSVREKMKQDVAEATKEFEKQFGLSLENVERMSVVLLDPPRSPERPLFFVHTVKPHELNKIKAEKNQYKGETLYVREKALALYALDERSLVYGENLDSLKALLDHPQPKQEEAMLAGAVRLAAGKHALVFGVNVKMVNDTIGGMLPGEAEPFLPLLQAKSATLAVDVGEQTRLSSALHFANEKDAKAAVKPGEAGLALMRNGLEMGIAQLGNDKETADLVKLLKQFESALKAVQIEQKGETLSATVQTKLDLAPAGVAFLQGVQKVRASASRAQSSNNLKQIALAMHNYHDTNGRLPPQATYDKNGKPMLSWRVLILPFVGDEELYKEFRLDEPWDSEHNKKLLVKMPRLYASPHDEKTLKDHTTYYQGFAGKGAFFDGKQGLRFADFTDGLSNTIMIAEASKAVPWSKPEDIPFDPAKPLPKLGRAEAHGFLTSLCDGSVHFISEKVTPETLRNAITRNDGNPLGQDF